LTAAEHSHRPLLLALGLGLLAAASVSLLLVHPIALVLSKPSPVGAYDVARMVLIYATLPRLVMALFCGAALGASGAILQQVLRNPLASPTTLGIDAGARLALALVTLLVPSLLGFGRDLVALLGSGSAMLLVFFIVRRRGFGALALVLAGLVVSLYCGASSSLLVLVKDRYLASLFIWGSGSLSQQSWQPCIALAWRLSLTLPPLILLLRPLELLELGDDGVRSLGVSVTRLRLMAIALAVALAAFVASAVGVIGFIGLVAPILARLAGARRFRQRVLLAALIGASLLVLTDATLQKLTGISAEFVPTGAVTAVLGSPLLLLLLPRLRAAHRPASYQPASLRTRRPTGATVLLVIAGGGLLLALALLVGRGAAGEWQWLPKHWHQLVNWRFPRVVAAFSAGALLGAAGVILQRLTNNEMASPEVLGVSAGAILGVASVLVFFDNLGPGAQGSAATVGSLGVLFALMTLGRRSGFAPERVLLAGIALNALIDAVVGVLSATGDPHALQLLAWMSGSASGRTMADATRAAIAAITLLPLGLLATRWLSILPLGGPPAQALGVPLARARGTLLLLAALMTASATLVAGPLTFVGLMAPHIASALGIRQPLSALLGAATTGAILMTTADWFARTLAFPLQLPTGLVATLLGAPFLMLLLSRRSTAS